MLALTLTLGLAITPGLVPGDYCNDRDERRTPWSREAKLRTIDRVEAMLELLEVGHLVRAYHLAVVCRESFCGEASVRHQLGEDRDGVPEDGLGPHGLSLRWHTSKLDGRGEPGFCTPEVSTAVAHEIIWRAVTRYGAANLVEVQAVYSGAVDCSEKPCRFELDARRRRSLCSRLAAYGADCSAKLGREDLGRRLAGPELLSVPLAQARAYLSAWLGR